MAGDPADIRSAPVQVGVGLEIEHRVVGVGHLGEVPAGSVQNSLRLARGARGVHDVERLLGVEGLGLVLARLAIHDVVPPQIAALGPGHVLPGSAYDQHGPNGRTPLQGLVDRRLECRRRAAPVPAVGGNDHPGIAVEDPVGQRGRREAAEHDGVRCAEARAGEHRDDGLGDHRQVDRDPITGLDPEFDQRVGRFAHLVGEFGIGERARVARFTFPVIGDLRPVPCLDVAVQAVVGDVEAPADEPLGERRVRPVQRCRPSGGPSQPLGLLLPEGQSVGSRLVVGLGVHVGRGREVRRGREAAIFVGQVGDRLGHTPEPSAGRWGRRPAWRSRS